MYNIYWTDNSPVNVQYFSDHWHAFHHHLASDKLPKINEKKLSNISFAKDNFEFFDGVPDGGLRL